jgi:hypothetical protein
MTVRRIPLPPYMDRTDRDTELRRLVLRYGRRKGIAASGWIEDRYPVRFRS